MAAFGDLEYEGREKDAMLRTYVECFRELMGEDATLVVPTFTYAREGPDSPYRHETTPSETGVLTEYLRKQSASLRSLHPVFSFTAIGRDREAICTGVSRNSYAWNTPTHRLVEADALVVSIGRSPHRGSFFIHLGEAFVGVPYRYTKELAIPVFVQNQPVTQPFYHYVKYPDADIVWDTNRLIERLESRHMVTYEPLGPSGIWAYKAKDVFETTVNLLMRNIYGLLAQPPTKTPWRK
jgi:aminoglycoside 3-N-acetyltransferase